MITDILSQLRRDEGEVPVLYYDAVGVPTVGVGHNLHTPMSERAMTVLLEDDLAAKDIELAKEFPWIKGLSDARLGVLRNMAFNIGVGGVMGFRRMLRAMQAARWEDAAKELLASHYALQVGDRARRLATQLRTDTWQ